jgi:hypothetical protein
MSWRHRRTPHVAGSKLDELTGTRKSSWIGSTVRREITVYSGKNGGAGMRPGAPRMPVLVPGTMVPPFSQPFARASYGVLSAISPRSGGSVGILPAFGVLYYSEYSCMYSEY